jgi:diketogulonate reductase-like aldo/keto reductase
MEPRLLDDPVITAVAKRVRKTPAQVLLAWAVQRINGSSNHIYKHPLHQGKFRYHDSPDEAMKEISQGINTRVRLNSVVETGIPGFIARGT